MDLSGGTSGLGIRVRRVPRGLLIEKILKDSSASHTSLREGDLIILIDGIRVSTMPTKGSKHLLSGPESTRVKLRIERNGKALPDLTVVRRRFAFEEAKVKHRLVPAPGNSKRMIGVIEIPSFYGRGGNDSNHDRSSAEDLTRIVSDLVKTQKEMASLVLDLRGNPGGYLEEAVTMAGLFIGNRAVVGVVENKTRRELRDTRSVAIYGGPLVVLVDEGSASAAEILAGALRDHQRAIVVGSEHTYGKGSVQKLFHLDDEAMLISAKTKLGAGVVKLTTSIFYSPLGHSPANGGIKSHITLPVMTSGLDSVAEGTSAGSVPEEMPFVEADALREIRERQGAFDSTLAALREKSALRMKREKAAAENSVEIDDNSMNPAGGTADLASEKIQIEETIAIAADYAKVRGGHVAASSAR